MTKWVVLVCDEDENCGGHFAVDKHNMADDLICPHCGTYEVTFTGERIVGKVEFDSDND